MKQTLPFKHVHLVGIKGVAMAALAVLLHDAGIKVTGSDIADDFPTKDELAEANIPVYIGFDAAHITGKQRPDAIFYTGAHNGRENVEVVAAKAAGIPVFPHGQALGMIMEGSRQIVVAGSHGKTTTSAMAAVLLSHAGIEPSWAIGCGAITGFGAAGKKGKGDFFVAEGDEYVTDPGHDQTPRFMWLLPEILIVTNVDFDHPDAYADLASVQAAFKKIQEKSGTVICNADDPNSRSLTTGNNVVTFGFSPNADYQITHVGVGEGRMFFTLSERGVALGEFSLKVPGKHNVANAVAAMVACHIAGVSWETLKGGITGFRGTKRRFELLHESKNTIRFYDDYAHHPTEIAATLKAARSWYPTSHIIAIFQPHTYSRTKTLLTEFSTCFFDADTVILTDIYASAREHDTLGINGMTLVAELEKQHSAVYFGKDTAGVIATLQPLLKDTSVVVFMGAGDIYNWEQHVIREVFT